MSNKARRYLHNLIRVVRILRLILKQISTNTRPILFLYFKRIDTIELNPHSKRTIMSECHRSWSHISCKMPIE